MLSTASTWSQFILTSIEILLLVWAGIKVVSKLHNKLDKLDDIDGRLKKVESQYVPNGGSSMRDAINRIEKNMDRLQERFENHIDKNGSE
jgi:hypothetical protein